MTPETITNVSTNLVITKDDLVNIAIETQLEKLETQEKVYQEVLDNVLATFKDIKTEFKNRLIAHIEKLFEDSIKSLKNFYESLDLDIDITHSYHGFDFGHHIVKIYDTDSAKNIGREFTKYVQSHSMGFTIYDGYTYELHFSNEKTSLNFKHNFTCPKTEANWFKKTIQKNITAFEIAQNDLLSIQAQIHELRYNSNRVKTTILKSALRSTVDGTKALRLLETSLNLQVLTD